MNSSTVESLSLSEKKPWLVNQQENQQQQQQQSLQEMIKVTVALKNNNNNNNESNNNSEISNNNKEDTTNKSNNRKSIIMENKKQQQVNKKPIQLLTNNEKEVLIIDTSLTKYNVVREAAYQLGFQEHSTTITTNNTISTNTNLNNNTTNNNTNNTTKINNTNNTAKTNDQVNLIWMDKSCSFERFLKLKPYQKINHFPSITEISKKDKLAQSLQYFFKKFKNNFKNDVKNNLQHDVKNNFKNNLQNDVKNELNYKFIPPTWILPKEEYKFLNSKKVKNLNNIYILKPTDSCQGKGILLFKEINKIFEYLQKFKNKNFIIQIYINNPLLLNNLFKFDLRIYILITCLDPLIIYLYKDGIVRICTEKYNLNNLNNNCIHLTNYSINKNSNLFLEFENKQNFNFFNNYIIDKFGNDCYNKIWKNIKDLIIKTILSIYKKLKIEYFKSTLNTKYSNFICFELLGFDIILNDKLFPYLLEVNHSPSYNTDTNLDKFIKLNLLKETLNLLNFKKCDFKKFKEFEKLSFKNRLQKKNTKYFQTKEMELQSYLENEKFVLNNYEKIFPPNNLNDQLKYNEFINHL